MTPLQAILVFGTIGVLALSGSCPAEPPRYELRSTVLGQQIIDRVLAAVAEQFASVAAARAPVSEFSVDGDAPLDPSMPLAEFVVRHALAAGYPVVNRFIDVDASGLSIATSRVDPEVTNCDGTPAEVEFAASLTEFETEFGFTQQEFDESVAELDEIVEFASSEIRSVIERNANK